LRKDAATAIKISRKFTENIVLKINNFVINSAEIYEIQANFIDSDV
jgi:hypothetical protein